MLMLRCTLIAIPRYRGGDFAAAQMHARSIGCLFCAVAVHIHRFRYRLCCFSKQSPVAVHVRSRMSGWELWSK
jgi:hypothetical protein